jgi:hypothetical protein
MKPLICYASTIGGCSNHQSYEHYVSKGLFNNNLITVQGQKWAKEPKTVGKSKIGLPILCTTHNTALSSIDAYAKEVFHILEICQIKQSERGNLPRSSLWRKDEFVINGTEFEKWMIKAAIGFTFENQQNKWHLEDKDLNNPPREIIESLFGRKTLNKPMGLYGLFAHGDSVKLEDRVSLISLLHPETKGYVGALVNFRHFQFLIYLNKEEISEYGFQSSTGVSFGLGGNYKPYYHNTKFEFTAKGKISSIIDFDWMI